MATVGVLKAILGLDTKQFEAGVAKARYSSKALASTLVSIGRTIGVLWGTAEIISFGKSLIQLGTNLSDVATKLGITSTQLQQFNYAAGQLGISTTTLETAISKFSAGLSQHVPLLQSLGVEIQRTSSGAVDVGATFNNVVAAISAIRDPTEQARLAVELFGRSGMELLKITNSSSQAFFDLQQQALQFGYVIDENTITKLDEVADMFDTLKTKMRSVGASMLSDLLPVILKIVEGFQKILDTLQNSEGLQAFGNLLFDIFDFALTAVVDLVDYILELADTIATGLNDTLSLTWQWVSSVFGEDGQTAIGNFGKALLTALRPVNLLKLAINGLVIIFTGLIYAMSKGVAWIVNTFNELVVFVKNTAKKIGAAIYRIFAEVNRKIAESLVKLSELIRSVSDTLADKLLQIARDAMITAKTLDETATRWENSLEQAQKIAHGFGTVGEWAGEVFGRTSAATLRIGEETEAVATAAETRRRSETNIRAVETTHAPTGQVGKKATSLDIGATSLDIGATSLDVDSVSKGLGNFSTDTLKIMEQYEKIVLYYSTTLDVFTQKVRDNFAEMNLSIGSFLQDSASAVMQFGDIVGGVYDTMAQALADLVSGAQVSGKRYAAAILKMVAQTVLALGREAAIKAVFALAEGFLFDEPKKFAAAKLYGAVAVGALAVGSSLMGAAQTLERQAQREEQKKSEQSGTEKSRGTTSSTTGGESLSEEGNLIINVNVEGHVVDVRDFAERIIAPAVAEAVGKRRAQTGVYNIQVKR